MTISNKQKQPFLVKFAFLFFAITFWFFSGKICMNILNIANPQICYATQQKEKPKTSTSQKNKFNPKNQKSNALTETEPNNHSSIYKWTDSYWYLVIVFFGLVVAALNHSLSLLSNYVTPLFLRIKKKYTAYKTRKETKEKIQSPELSGSPIAEREIKNFITCLSTNSISKDFLAELLHESNAFRAESYNYNGINYRRKFFERNFLTSQPTTTKSLIRSLSKLFKSIETEVDYFYYVKKESNENFLSPFSEELPGKIKALNNEQLNLKKIEDGAGIIILETMLLSEDDLITSINQLKFKNVKILGCAILFSEEGINFAKTKKLINNSIIHVAVTLDLNKQQ